jgi:hypothetical protein
MSDFIDVARGTLDLEGVTLADGDADILGMIALAFAPAMEALDGADLRELPLEPDLDPGRPPRSDRSVPEAR